MANVTNNKLEIRVTNIADQGHLIQSEYQTGSENHQVYFRCDNTVLTTNNEAFIALGFPYGLKNGGTIRAEGDISQQFLSSAPTMLDIYTVWFPTLKRFDIQGVKPVTKIKEQGQGVGVFFTGGMDSFYTLLKYRNEITHLVYVHGFDIKLDQTWHRQQTSEMLHRVASGFNVRLIEIETNLRSFTDQYLHWTLAHGSAFACIGHLLAPGLRRLYISASNTYDMLHPWGTHPMLDPLWSSELIEFFHAGCEATRIDKAKKIAESEVALHNLRVCWKNQEGSYNCGRCEKCLRTMINLHIAGALDRCTTFNEPLDIDRVARMNVTEDFIRPMVIQNIKALENREGDEELRNALVKVLNRPQWKMKLKNKLKGYRYIYKPLLVINNIRKKLSIT